MHVKEKFDKIFNFLSIIFYIKNKYMIMNNKNMYAYILLGAVLLAGVAGYMMADQADSDTVILPDTNEVLITVTIAGNSLDADVTTEDNYGSST